MLTPTHVIKGVNNEASFDVKSEIVPACCLVQDSNVVFANTSLPYSDQEGLVEYAKANPGVPILTLQSITGIDAMSAQQLFNEAAFTDIMDNDDTWKEWKEVNGLNDRDGQFTQEEMKQVWNDYFDTISDIAKQ